MDRDGLEHIAKNNALAIEEGGRICFSLGGTLYACESHHQYEAFQPKQAKIPPFLVD